MKLPRDLSGVELIKLLCQEGSHAILETAQPRQHRISIPCHDPLRVGTLNAILRAVAAVHGVEKEDILSRL